MAVVLGVGGCGGGEARPEPPAQQFASRPDLRPPRFDVLTPARETAPGYLFLAPKRRVAQSGPLIVDDRGRPIWFDPHGRKPVADFRVQRYHGRPVLTWWEGGGYRILDSSYRDLAVVRAGNGLTADMHEFLLTPRGTAICTIFHRVERDGVPVVEGVVQEIDVASGRVLFEWHSIDHVALTESYARRPANGRSYDYFHVNSIAVDRDGGLLVSARNTHAVYKLDRRSGRIVWRLGGKRSDFAFAPGARFAWQHDARPGPDGTISLFDNEAAPQVGSESRGLVLRVERRRRRVTLVRSLVHRPPLVAVDQGNLQLLPDGHYLVGWGHRPYVTEYDARGRVLLDLRFGTGADSYRAYRFRWTGHPTEPPAATVRRDGRRTIVYASWNGATEVAHWQVLAGPRVVVTARRSGFETRIVVTGTPRVVRVRALAADGRILGMSR